MIKIGKREITVMLKDLAVSRPNETNPVTKEACVYDKKGPKGIRHCVAGQIVRDVGYQGSLDFSNTIDGVVKGDWDLDDIPDTVSQEKFRAWLNKTFTPAALNVLNDAQTIADGRGRALFSQFSESPATNRAYNDMPAELRRRKHMPWGSILYILPLNAADRKEVEHLLEGQQ